MESNAWKVAFPAALLGLAYFYLANRSKRKRGSEPVTETRPLEAASRVAKKTGYIWHEKCFWHNHGIQTGWYRSQIGEEDGQQILLEPSSHFETAMSKRRIHNILCASNLIHHLQVIPPRMCTRAELMFFHTEKYIDRVSEMSDGMGGDAGDDCPLGKGSFEIAQLSVGAGLSAVDAVMTGAISNCYVLNRPPGHHAVADEGKGFCLFNNIALAAMYAQRKYKVKRIAILDWDVHHGNGTESAFYKSSDVLFISIHEDQLYPETRGFIADVGEGEGKGFTLNIPLPPGAGEEAYQYAMDQVVIPAIDSFVPELILVSCGFDPHCFDPTSHMLLSSQAFVDMTKAVIQLASKHAQDRLILFHEGGYSEHCVPFAAVSVIEELALAVATTSSSSSSSVSAASSSSQGEEKSQAGLASYKRVQDPYRKEVVAMAHQKLAPHQKQAVDAAAVNLERYLYPALTKRKHGIA